MRTEPVAEGPAADFRLPLEVGGRPGRPAAAAAAGPFCEAMRAIIA